MCVDGDPINIYKIVVMDEFRRIFYKYSYMVCPKLEKCVIFRHQLPVSHYFFVEFGVVFIDRTVYILSTF